MKDINREVRMQMIKVSFIRPNKNQPRTIVDPEFRQGLVDSIRETGGINEPLMVKELEKEVDGVKYKLVNGENRWHAAQILGLTEVLCLVVRVADDMEQFEIAFVGDIARDSLTDWDVAHGLKRLMDERDLSQSQAAKRVGQTQGWVWKRLQILKAPLELQKLIGPETPKDHRLALSQFLELMKAPDRDKVALAKATLERRLSVGNVRRLATQATGRQTCLSKRQKKPTALFREFALTIGSVVARLDKLASMPEAEFKEIIAAGQAEQVREVASKLKAAVKNLTAVMEWINQPVASNGSAGRKEII